MGLHCGIRTRGRTYSVAHRKNSPQLVVMSQLVVHPSRMWVAVITKPSQPTQERRSLGRALLCQWVLEQGWKVLVVNGAGQNGVWEDAAGRKGDIETVRALRQNIEVYAMNSAEAKKAWSDKPEIDAWLFGTSGRWGVRTRRTPWPSSRTTRSTATPASPSRSGPRSVRRQTISWLSEIQGRCRHLRQM